MFHYLCCKIKVLKCIEKAFEKLKIKALRSDRFVDSFRYNRLITIIFAYFNRKNNRYNCFVKFHRALLKSLMRGSNDANA